MRGHLNSVRNSSELSGFPRHRSRSPLGIRRHRSLFHRTLPVEWQQLPFLIRPPCYAPHGVRVENERGHPIDGLGFSILPHYRVRRRAGSRGRATGGFRTYEGKKERQRSEQERRRGRRVCTTRARWWGFWARAAAPSFLLPRNWKGGPCAPYAGGSACASCVYRCTYGCLMRLRVRAPRWEYLSVGQRVRARATHSLPVDAWLDVYWALLFRELCESESHGHKM